MRRSHQELPIEETKDILRNGRECVMAVCSDGDCHRTHDRERIHRTDKGKVKTFYCKLTTILTKNDSLLFFLVNFA